MAPLKPDWFDTLRSTDMRPCSLYKINAEHLYSVALFIRIGEPKMQTKARTILIGVITLLVGITLVVLFYPLWAIAPLYYSGPAEIPDEVEDGDTIKMCGWVYDAEEVGDYTVMVVDWDNGESTALVGLAEDNYKAGSRVIITTEYKEDVDYSDYEEMELTTDEKDELLETMADMEEEDVEVLYDAYDNDITESTVEKGPDTWGWVGIVVGAIGLFIIAFGALLRDRMCGHKDNKEFCKWV